MLAACLGVTPAARAQRVLGPWEDATIPPRGVLRTAIGVHFGHWSRRFGLDGTAESLGADLTRDSLGPAVLPGMGGLATALDALVGPGSALTLGSLRTRLEVTEARVPITIDYGVTDRIGIGFVVPYVKNHVHVTASPNAEGPAATLGLNPAWSFPGARIRNDAVVAGIGAAASTLTGELARCQGLTDPSCAAINADRQGAAALVVQAGLAADAVASVFGTSTVSGSAYAPLAGGPLQQAVNARLTALGDAFAGFLGPAQGGQWIPARPVAAPLLAGADLDKLIGDPAWGISARPLSDYEHSHIGDVELGVRLKLLDGFGSGVTAAALPRPGALRLTVAGIYRLGTGQLDLPYDFTDVGTGDRQADLEVRALADVAIGRRIWASGAVRYGVQRPDRLVRRIPDRAGDPFPEAVREQEVSRDLGDVLEFELAPRWVPGDAFSFSALYRHRTKGEDRFAGTFGVTSTDGTPLDLDAGVLGAGTKQVERLLGLAATYSTVRGYALRQSRFPLEVSLVHTRVLGGRGGVPSHGATGLVFRLYRPSVGSDPLRP